MTPQVPGAPDEPERSPGPGVPPQAEDAGQTWAGDEPGAWDESAPREMLEPEQHGEPEEYGDSEEVLDVEEGLEPEELLEPWDEVQPWEDPRPADELAADPDATGWDGSEAWAEPQGEQPAPEVVVAAAPVPQTPLQRLRGSIRPSLSRSQLMVGFLCALLGFALVVQVRQSGQAELSSLRQDDLVRLLDEVTVRAEQLDAEVGRLQSNRDELASGTGQAQAALEVALQRAASEGILSGRLPAQGPGIVVTIRSAGPDLRAQHMFNMLEELRNAGAEVVQVNDVRIVTSSSFVDVTGGIAVDGFLLTQPIRWTVIGDPATLDRALEIPGGALPTIRNAGGTATTEQQDLVTIDATVALTDPEFARPAQK